MSPSKIIILNDRSGTGGGTTSLALLSARLFVQAGHKVTFVTGDSGDHCDLPNEVDVVALEGEALLDTPLSARFSKGIFNRKAYELVKRVVRLLDGPNVIYHLHGWAQTLSPSALAALSSVQHRLVIHAHDFFHACPNGTYFNFRQESVCNLRPLSTSCIATNCDKRNAAQKAYRVARMLVNRRLFSLRETKAIFAIIHPFMSEWMERAGIPKDRLRVVRNPVTAFRQERVAAEMNSDLFFIGRVESEKGPELAAQAATIAGRRLRIIGDGSERARLEAKFPDVVWEGWRSHEQIAELIRSARGLIMPSRLPEPFGLVSLEALQSGVPLVAFADSFVARESAEIDCAFVASDRRPETLASAVRMLEDDERVRQASVTAFEQTKQFSNTPESWRDELLDLYRELLLSSAAPPIHSTSHPLRAANARGSM